MFLGFFTFLKRNEPICFTGNPSLFFSSSTTFSDINIAPAIPRD